MDLKEALVHVLQTMFILGDMRSSSRSAPLNHSISKGKFHCFSKKNRNNNGLIRVYMMSAIEL